MRVPFKVVIPARYASTRLPGKPLRLLANKPLIQHVYERGCASGTDEVLIATDDQRIADSADSFGASVCMTRADHPSGTDRLAEVVEQRNWSDDTVVVNLQGDEPLMPAELIIQVAKSLHDSTDAEISTLCAAIEHPDDMMNPNVVKVVRDCNDYAMYFSRAPIPWDREGKSNPGSTYRHIGLYAYRAGFIRKYPTLEAAPMELLEHLEQLRALWHGIRIRVEEATVIPGPGVDTEQELQHVEQLMRG